MKKMKFLSLNVETIYVSKQQVALLLGYLDPGRLIRRNVDPEDKTTSERLIEKKGGGGGGGISFEFSRVYTLFE